MIMKDPLTILTVLMEQAVLLLAPERECGVGEQEQARPRPMFGFVVGSEALASFLGGIKLLQMMLLFLGAHTASFPLWPTPSEVGEVQTGWQIAVGEQSKLVEALYEICTDTSPTIMPRNYLVA